MKNIFVREFWYILVLAGVAAIELCVLIVSGLSSIGHYHDAGLAQIASTVFGLFFLMTGSCLALELILLKRHKRALRASARTSFLVLCVGLLPALIMVRMWIALI